MVWQKPEKIKRGDLFVSRWGNHAHAWRIAQDHASEMDGPWSVIFIAASSRHLKIGEGHIQAMGRSDTYGPLSDRGAVITVFGGTSAR